MFKKIVTALFAIIGLAVVVYITITATTYALSHELALQIYQDAQTNQDFDSFVRYQTKLGKKLYDSEVNDYYVALYQVVIETSTGYENQLLVIVDAKVPVDSAANQLDTNDQMSVKIYQDDLLIHDTKTDENYQGYALSYGFDVDVLGFVYVGFTLEINNDQLSFEIFDYHGELITTNEVSLDYVTYDPNGTNYDDFLKGYTVDEISNMLQLSSVLTEKVSINVLIYLVVVIFGLGIYYFLKKYFKLKNG